MENEKSSVEILKDIAKKESWEIDISTKNVNKRYGVNERFVLVQNHKFRDSFFISVQTSNTTKYRLYSGVFYPVRGLDTYKLLIRKRDAMDKLSFRKDKLRFKIGSNSFDSKIFIETNNDIETHKLLSNSKIQKEIVEFLSFTDRLLVGVNEINPDFSNELKGKSFFSVFMFMEWMLDKELIDKAFRLGELLNSKLNQK